MKISRGDFAIGALIIALMGGFLVAQTRLGTDDAEAKSDDGTGEAADGDNAAKAVEPAADGTSGAVDNPEMIILLDEDDDEGAGAAGEGEGSAAADSAAAAGGAAAGSAAAGSAAVDSAGAGSADDDLSDEEVAEFLARERTFPALFRVGEASPPNIRAQKITEFSRKFARCTGEVVVSGHTDASGARGENKRISKDRARFVQAMLVQHGVPGDRVVIRAAGSREPRGDNATPEGRDRNRRVTVRCEQ